MVMSHLLGTERKGPVIWNDRLIYFHLRVGNMERPLSPRTGLYRIARSEVPGSLIQN